MATLTRTPLKLPARISRRPFPSQNARTLAPLSTNGTLEPRNCQCYSLHTKQASMFDQKPIPSASQISKFSHDRGLRYPKTSGSSRRDMSTNTSVGTTESDAAANAAINARSGTAELLTWNDFLRLRKIRRRFNLAASTTLAATSFVGGLGWLSEQNLEQLGANLFGLDSLTLGALSALGFAGAGWVIGPFIGSAIWRVSYSSRVKGMALKERDFFHRIKKHRADPTQSSVRNPAPDYYGEKITSVQGYRQWLKDQREFNRKRQLTA